MTRLTRFFLAAVALAALTALTAAGCGSSRVAGAALASTASSALSTTPSSSAPFSAARAVSTTPSSAAVVYLAEGGSVGGTAVHAPACQTGCQLSGDGTTSLWDMTWATWNSTVAVGTGTEKLDDCTPDCAAGTLHPVPVKVTLSRPVMVCVSDTGKWFWTRVSFIWPAGLPAAFSGGNAPLNPFDYSGIAAQAAKSCP
jgi:hypothetical protein